MRRRRSGDRIGRWRLESLLGRGANAEVWRAVDDRGTAVALKILNNVNPRSAAYRRFRDEIAVLRLLGDFPGILPLRDASLPERPARRDPAWLAMPEAVGIRDALGNSPALDAVVSAVGEIANTLASLAAQHGVHHRDIKPANLYRLGDAWAVGDFGLVTFPGKEDLTRPAHKLGPLAFMAPEMFTHPETAAEEPADVYALAKTLWALGCGEKWPPQGEIRVADEDVRLSARVSSARAVLLDGVIAQATKNRPEHRPSLAAFDEELSGWIRPHTPTASALSDDELRRRIARIEDPRRAREEELQARTAAANAAHEALKEHLNEINRQLNEYGLRTIYTNSEIVFSELGASSHASHYRVGWEARGLADSNRTDGRGALEIVAAIGADALEDESLSLTAALAVGENLFGRDVVWTNTLTVIPGTARAAAATGELGCEMRERLSTVMAVFTDRLEARFPPPILRDNLAAATGSDGLIYVFGGQYQFGGGALATAERFDPRGESWSECVPLPTARMQPGAAAVGACIVVVGGHTHASHVDAVEVLDVSTNSWSAAAPLPQARSETACAVHGGQLFAAGGYGDDGEGIRRVDVYDPTADSWQGATPLVRPRRGHALVADERGLLHVIGGWVGGRAYAGVETLDPSTGAWLAKSQMPTPRAFGAAALGVDGRIYVAGGWNGERALDLIEAYDPVADVWERAGRMRRPRTNFAAATSLDGRVIAFGGKGPETEWAEVLFAPADRSMS